MIGFMILEEPLAARGEWRLEGRGGHQETSLVIVAGDQPGSQGLTGGSSEGEKWREGQAGGGEESGVTAWVWGYDSREAGGGHV